MDKKFIALIVIFCAGCVYFGLQWQDTRNDLSLCEDKVLWLEEEVDWRDEQIANRDDIIQEQNSQIGQYEQIMNTQATQISELRNARDQAYAEIERLIPMIEEAKFTFYYASLTKQRFGVDDLQDYLERWEWIEGSYAKDRFDCSEMSTYLEWKLENEGYNAVIVAGESPDGVGDHAWLLVETTEDAYMPVEPTTYSIIYWDHPYFDNYFVYDYSFETIQEAISFQPDEFNWWQD